MTLSKDISKGINELCFSRVKADRDAIARLEKAMGVPVTDILECLEESSIIEANLVEDDRLRSIPDRPSKVGQIITSGLIGASASGLIFLAANSPSVPTAISLGFIGGAAIAKNGEK